MSPSPEMKAALQAIQDARKIIDQLKRVAIQRRDPAATQALVEVASVATLAVRALWFDRSFEFDPEDAARALAARREWLSYQFSDARLPVLHSWEGASDTQQEAMLKGIEFGPFKGRRGKGKMKMLITAMILPQFQRIQFAPQRPAGIEGKIWDLPPPAPETAKLWADVIVAWLWNRHREKMENPDSWLYGLARAEHGLDLDRRKRKKTLIAKREKWLREGGGEMSHVDATWSEHEEKSIAEMKVTPAHIQNGLKAEILGYFSRNLSR